MLKSETSKSPAWSIDKLLVLRLAFASALFAVALAVKMSDWLSAVFLVLSAAAAGYDVVMKAVDDVAEKNYFGASLILTFTAVISFAIGFGIEGTALVILYKIGLLLVDYTRTRTIRSALDFIDEDKDEAITHVSLLFRQEQTGKDQTYEKLEKYLSLATKILAAAALIYAVMLPLISDHTYTVSIHRALTLLIIATPLSVLSSLTLADIVGIGYTAANGVIYNSSSVFDETKDISSVVFDRSGVFSDGVPRLTAVKSNRLPPEMFIKIAAHIVSKSEKPWAKGIVDAYDGQINSDIAGMFTEYPEGGAEIQAGGLSMCLGTKAVMDTKGIAVPPDDDRQGMVFYMAISGQCSGCLVMAENEISGAETVVPAFNDNGVESCILLSGAGSEESAKLAKALGMSEYYSDCTGDNKSEALKQCREGLPKGKLLYVYAKPSQAHSTADIDACVGTSNTNADLFLKDNGLLWLPLAIGTSHRSGTVKLENIIAALFVKVLIIALTLTGFCNLWFAVFLDMAAALATILNTIRVTMPPLISRNK